MWLIAGLGNPGGKYEMTRHNIGFIFIDVLAKSLEAPAFKNQNKSSFTQISWLNEQIVLLKPQTFMNLSGESVQALMQFYKIPVEKLIVVHDEIDQPFAKMKIQKNRGHGGHNGIRSISQLLGTNDYTRLRLGVGRPAHPEFAVADYVLQNFTKEEQTELVPFLERAGDAVESIITEGVPKASTKFNT